MKRFIVTAAILAMAVPAYGAVGDNFTWDCARDTGNAKGDDIYCNFGGRSSVRAYKYRWQEGIMMDWYAPADSYSPGVPAAPIDRIQEMKDWMTANPLGSNEKYEFSLRLGFLAGGNLGGGVEPDGKLGRYQIRTLNLQNDWAEGNGPTLGVGYVAFNWDKGVAAATDAYAQTWYTDTDGVPGGAGPNGQDEVLDTANCVPWVSGTGTTYSSFQNSDQSGLPWEPGGTTRHINGIYDKNQNGSIDPEENTPIFVEFTIDTGNAQIVWTELQYDPNHQIGWFPQPVVNDLLYNDYNRGLVLGRFFWYDEFDENQNGTFGWEEYAGSNQRVYTNQQNSAWWPQIKIEIVATLPIPGDVNDDGWVDGADYTAWADNYDPNGSGFPPWSQGGWTVGNFTEDDVVDGADYTVWADEYNPPPAGVPEPGFAALLACGGLALLRRRARR
jgi:hypothetical protein